MNKIYIILIITLFLSFQSYSQSNLKFDPYQCHVSLKSYISDVLEIRDSITCKQSVLYKNFYPEGIQYGNFEDKLNIENINGLSDSLLCINQDYIFNKNLRIVGNLFNIVSKEYAKTRIGDEIYLVEMYEYDSDARHSNRMSRMRMYFNKELQLNDKISTYLLSVNADEHYFHYIKSQDSIFYNDRALILINMLGNKLMSFIIVGFYKGFTNEPQHIIYTTYKGNGIFQINSTITWCSEFDREDIKKIYTKKFNYSLFRIDDKGFIKMID